MGIQIVAAKTCRCGGTDFYKDRSARDGLDRVCKKCAKAHQKALRTKNPNIHRNSHLRRLYGISHEQYEEMFARQRGVCAICGKHQSEQPSKRLAVDHNHETGEIRKLLCIHCNAMIGNAREDVAILEKAIEYLRCYK